MKNGMIFVGMGFELVAMAFGGFMLGEAIDRHFGWQGLASTGLVLILLVGWFVHLIYLLRRFDQENVQDQ